MTIDVWSLLLERPVLKGNRFYYICTKYKIKIHRRSSYTDFDYKVINYMGKLAMEDTIKTSVSRARVERSDHTSPGPPWLLNLLFAELAAVSVVPSTTVPNTAVTTSTILQSIFLI